jgi:hypothetical protein
MSKVASRQLVIDADVARAAGDSPDATGVSRACREFLRTVLAVCHHAVWTPSIAAEWKRQASRFSRKWRVQMAARRKLDECLPTLVPGLEKRILSANPTGLKPESIRKDLHLVYAALETAGPVASHDAAIRRRLAVAAPKAPELRDLVWIDPAAPDAQAIEWLNKGAPLEPGRMLGCLNPGPAA